jgi:hypothetical protein
MKKAVIILSTIALLGCGHTKKTEQACTSPLRPNESLTMGETYIDTVTYINQEFISYFPDMVLGKHIDKHKRIPHKTVTEFLPDLGMEAFVNTEMYAVGKISNYKGLDLFIIDYEGERPDEDSYDNHTDSLRFLLLFKNNKPVMDKEDPERRLFITLVSHYYGEGGESLFKCYFDADTTLVCHQYDSESESATGYNTPFNSTKEYRATINSNGEREIREVTKMEFSSPFYDRNFLKENQSAWGDVDDESFNHSYPTKNNKWNLGIDVWYNENPSLLNPPVYLSFHIETIDGELIPIFESYNNEQHDKRLDKYVIGQVRNDVLVKKDYTNRSAILKCPIIIKTSDGDLELLPDGKLLLLNK